MTAAEILAAHPAAAAEIEAAGAAKERARISALLELNTTAHRAIAGKAIDAAMLDGKTQAGDLAIQILAAQRQQLEKISLDRAADAKDIPAVMGGDPDPETAPKKSSNPLDTQAILALANKGTTK